MCSSGGAPGGVNSRGPRGVPLVCHLVLYPGVFRGCVASFSLGFPTVGVPWAGPLWWSLVVYPMASWVVVLGCPLGETGGTRDVPRGFSWQ